jgi:hypothetical protein
MTHKISFGLKSTSTIKLIQTENRVKMLKSEKLEITGIHVTKDNKINKVVS